MKTLLDKVTGKEVIFQKACLPLLALMDKFNVENVNITFIGDNVSVQLKTKADTKVFPTARNQTTAQTANVSPVGGGE